MTPLTFVTVCEARADFQTASALADRVVCDQVDWIEPAILDACRQWLGNRDGTTFLRWSQAHSLAKQVGRKAHGHFRGEPGDLDALAARKAILVVLAAYPEAAAVFLIRDSDGRTERIKGLVQARLEFEGAQFQVVIGVAHCKREAWVLAGFEPTTAPENELLDALRGELGFHPCERSHELDATHDYDKRSAKRILAKLLRGDDSREADCWMNSALSLLRTRGASSGLRAYLDEVQALIVPLISGIPHRPPS